METDTRFQTRWYKSIAFKVSVTIIFLILSLVFILSTLFFRYTERETETELRQRGTYIAKTLAQQAVEPLLYEDRFALFKLLDAFKEKDRSLRTEESIVEYAAIYGHDNTLLAFVGREKKPEILDHMSDLDRVEKEAVILPRNREVFEVIAPILVNKIPAGKVRVGVTRSFYQVQIRHLHQQLWGVAVLLSVLGTFVSLFLTRRYILPLLQVIRGAKKIGEGNWGTQIRVRGRDETGELASTFNEMSIKLKEAFDRVQRTHEKLVRSEKLNAIGKFSANLAHELKNPLTSIKLSMQAMNEPGAVPTLNKEEREMVLKDIQRMDDVVSRFLKYGAPPQIRLKSVDMNALLSRICGKLRPRMQAARVHLKMFPDQDLPEVFCDARKMEEAMENICVNAMQAVPEGGEIRVRTSRNGDEEAIRIDVEDSGRGIDANIRDHLFEPFYTTRKDGSGLGLSIVHQIIQEHGGDISIKSEKGKGTVFSIHLPV